MPVPTASFYVAPDHTGSTTEEESQVISPFNSPQITPPTEPPSPFGRTRGFADQYVMPDKEGLNHDWGKMVDAIDPNEPLFVKTCVKLANHDLLMRTGNPVYRELVERARLQDVKIGWQDGQIEALRYVPQLFYHEFCPDIV